jgi:hypothetical protein
MLNRSICRREVLGKLLQQYAPMVRSRRSTP